MSRERANRVHAVVNVQNVFVRRRDRGKRVRERRNRNHAVVNVQIEFVKTCSCITAAATVIMKGKSDRDQQTRHPIGDGFYGLINFLSNKKFE